MYFLKIFFGSFKEISEKAGDKKWIITLLFFFLMIWWGYFVCFSKSVDGFLEYLLMVGEWWFELGEKEKGRSVKMSKK